MPIKQLSSNFNVFTEGLVDTLLGNQAVNSNQHGVTPPNGQVQTVAGTQRRLRFAWFADAAL